MSKRAERVQSSFAGLALLAIMGLFLSAHGALAASAGSASLLVLPFQVHLATEQPNFATEFPVVPVLADRLAKKLPDVKIRVSRRDKDPFCYYQPPNTPGQQGN